MKKNILIIFAIVALMVLAASASAQEEGALITTSGGSGLDTEAGLIAAKFIKQISILNKVKIDDSIFSDPTFMTLSDWSRPIPDEAAGRVNPFAPF